MPRFKNPDTGEKLGDITNKLIDSTSTERKPSPRKPITPKVGLEAPVILLLPSQPKRATIRHGSI